MCSLSCLSVCRSCGCPPFHVVCLSDCLSVGLSVGAVDVLPFTSVGDSLDGQMEGLSLSLTDADTNTPVYYISVVAVNGAGMESDPRSSRSVVNCVLVVSCFL